MDILKWILLLLLISGCSVAPEKFGFWVKEKPFRGTLEKNRNHVSPYFQCVEREVPHRSKKCEEE
tara:strand:+ start:130 stop:324 length:195 start_codon:yes stop_codon:yes gene_type:complete